MRRHQHLQEGHHRQAAGGERRSGRGGLGRLRRLHRGGIAARREVRSIGLGEVLPARAATDRVLVLLQGQRVDVAEEVFALPRPQRVLEHRARRMLDVLQRRQHLAQLVQRRAEHRRLHRQRAGRGRLVPDGGPVGGVGRVGGIGRGHQRLAHRGLGVLEDRLELRGRQHIGHRQRRIARHGEVGLVLGHRLQRVVRPALGRTRRSGRRLGRRWRGRRRRGRLRIDDAQHVHRLVQVRRPRGVAHRQQEAEGAGGSGRAGQHAVLLQEHARRQRAVHAESIGRAAAAHHVAGLVGLVEPGVGQRHRLVDQPHQVVARRRRGHRRAWRRGLRRWRVGHGRRRPGAFGALGQRSRRRDVERRVGGGGGC